MKPKSAKLKRAWYNAAVREDMIHRWPGELTADDVSDIYIAHQCPYCGHGQLDCKGCSARSACSRYGDILRLDISYEEKVARMLWEAGGREYA